MEQLITLIKQQKERQLSDSQIGVAVDYLYQLDYFHHLAQQYGKFYLVFLLQHKFIDIYNLRQHRPLIDTKHLYVMVSGKVNKNGFNKGTEIIVQRDGHVNTLKDSVFLKISIEKIYRQPKLKQLQKSINKERFIMETLIRQSQQKQQIFKKLNKIQIFSHLPKYDFLQLVNWCQYRSLLNGKRTHQFQKPVESIIYIIEGEVKLSFPYSLQSSNPKKIDQFLQRYLKEKSKANKKQITTNFSQDQWIGIDEHFQHVSQRSYGIVMSVEAQLLYVPVKLFDRLFNEKCNHTLFTKIEYKRKIRSEMLEKSTQTQVQKQAQILRWSQQQNPLPPELRRKLSKYQLGEEFDEMMTNPEHDKLVQSRKKTISINKPKRLIHLSSSPLQQSRNKGKLKNSLPVSLNKLQNKEYPRVNLFPQEYSKQFILPSQKREIDEAESKKNINLMMYLQPKHHRKACENKHCHSFSNSVNQEKLQNKLFQMAKSVAQNYAQNSTFYRGHFNKGDELSNLNLKTIGALQPSRKELLLKRKNEIYCQKIQRQMNSLGLSEFFLPGLKTKSTVKDFKPMSPRKNLDMDLSQHLLDQNYNMESKNTLLSRHKQSSHTISIRNVSSRTVEFRNHSKTLFVKPEDLQRSKVSRTIDSSSFSKKRHFKKQPSVLNIY